MQYPSHCGDKRNKCFEAFSWNSWIRKTSRSHIQHTSLVLTSKQPSDGGEETARYKTVVTQRSRSKYNHVFFGDTGHPHSSLQVFHIFCAHKNGSIRHCNWTSQEWSHYAIMQSELEAPLIKRILCRENSGLSVAVSFITCRKLTAMPKGSNKHVANNNIPNFLLYIARKIELEQRGLA